MEKRYICKTFRPSSVELRFEKDYYVCERLCVYWRHLLRKTCCQRRQNGGREYLASAGLSTTIRSPV